jgi:Putative amidoligase enzyme
MYNISVVAMGKKPDPKEYTRYKHVKHLLSEFYKTRDQVGQMKNVMYAQQELQSWIRDFRNRQKTSKLKYTVDYDIQNRTWKKMIGNLSYTFEINSPLDKSIINNTNHLKIHKTLLLPTSKFEKLKEFKQIIRDKYQDSRQKLRALRVHRKTQKLNNLGVNISYEICGGIIHNRMKPVFGRGESPRGYISKEIGAIMKFARSKDKQIVFEEKKPQTKDNYVGVELEFFCDLNAEDLAFKLYEYDLGKNVYLRQDASIRQEGSTYPHEVNILAKEKDVEDVIKRVSKVLLAANAKVNKSCGMHVHLDMRNRDHEIAFHNLVSSQNILFAMNPFSRQNGTYCKRQDTKVFKEASVNHGSRDDRYYGINALAHARHNTIEIRIHSGTVQASKINNWITLLLNIINKKSPVARAASTLRAFIKQYDIDSKLGLYIAERMSKFVGKEEVEERGAA